MNRMLRPFIAGGLICAAAVTAAGCAENDSTLFIYGVLKELPPACTVLADPASEMIGSGRLDIALRTNYEAWLLVGNQYAPRGAKQQLRTETTRVTLTGAEITLKDAASGKVLSCKNQPNCGQFSVYGSGFANSSKSEDPGWGAISAQLIPSAVGESYLADLTGALSKAGPSTIGLVATVRAFGTTLGGQDVETGGFSFPIQVCNGCLIDYSSIVFPATKCTLGANETVTAAGCRMGQDESVDCRACLPADVCRCPGGVCN
jgi:hypothetical protein